MANNNKDEKGTKNATKVVIITSVDDDNDQIFSYLNPSKVEKIIVDLNDTNIMDTYQIHNNKRSLSKSVRFFL